jgi:hypothetical protein
MSQFNFDGPARSLILRSARMKEWSRYITDFQSIVCIQYDTIQYLVALCCPKEQMWNRSGAGKTLCTDPRLKVKHYNMLYLSKRCATSAYLAWVLVVTQLLCSLPRLLSLFELDFWRHNKCHITPYILFGPRIFAIVHKCSVNVLLPPYILFCSSRIFIVHKIVLCHAYV